MKVLALTKYGTLAASTRQRFLQYRQCLAAADIQLDISPLLDNDYLRPFMDGRRPSMTSVARAYGRRFKALAGARSYDLLWVHCELFPYLPSIIENGAARLAGRPIVFDYDDAIFHMYDENASPAVRMVLSGKLGPLLRQAAACTCGNEYLRDYAARYCPNAIVIPTVVDTDIYLPIERSRPGPIVIGWIGSPTTWPNVRPLLPLLSELCAGGDTIVRAIGTGPAAERDRFPGLHLVEWSEAREVGEVQHMDIGIMPLIDSPFERGKSGYKLIQYMACGLPVVASPVGVNRTIVADGINGYLATSEGEWRQSLSKLIGDRDLRLRMGAEGRKRVETSYTFASQAPQLIDLFQTVDAGR